MKAREVIRAIESRGGYHLRTRGSHNMYRADALDGTTAQTTVAVHGATDIPAGTLRAIERDLEPVFGKGWLR